MARMILTQPGEAVHVGGNVTVVGTTNAGEVITVVVGTITLDPSFNSGGDTIRLPGNAGDYTVRMSGSQAILETAGVKLSVPVGSTGIEIAFQDASRMLAFDKIVGAVRLGVQSVTAAISGVVPNDATMVGTEGANSLIGTNGNDVVYALGGNDTVDGGAGSDTIHGGAGDDDITGGLGNDRLFGGDGNDKISDYDGISSYIEGGAGNDFLSVVNNIGTSFQISGGDGDDYVGVFVGKTGSAIVDAGAGNDRVMFMTEGMPISMTLGSGRDELVFIEHALALGVFGIVTISDFEAGASGDTVDILNALPMYLRNWDQSTDPFLTGHLRLIDREGQAVLQIDRDGPSASLNGFRDLIIFSGQSEASFTKENFGGYDPHHPAQAALSISAELVDWMDAGTLLYVGDSPLGGMNDSMALASWHPAYGVL